MQAPKIRFFFLTCRIVLLMLIGVVYNVVLGGVGAADEWDSAESVITSLSQSSPYLNHYAAFPSFRFLSKYTQMRSVVASCPINAVFKYLSSNHLSIAIKSILLTLAHFYIANNRTLYVIMLTKSFFHLFGALSRRINFNHLLT